MFDVLAIGSVHLPATSHVRSGLTRDRSALCIVVGASLGPFVVVRRYVSLLDCHCLVLVVAGGPTCHHSAPCVVVGPSSSSGHPRRRAILVVGPSSSLGCHLARTRRRWWAHSSSSGRGQGLLIVFGTSPGPTYFHWVSLSYSSSLGPRSLMLASFT